MQTNKALRQKVAVLESQIEVYRGYVNILEELREVINAGVNPLDNFPRLLDTILDLYRYANGPIEGGGNVQEHPEGQPAGVLRQQVNFPAPPPPGWGFAAPDPINFQFRRR